MKILKDKNITQTKQDKKGLFVINRFVPPEITREIVPGINEAKLRGDTQIRS